MARHRLRHVLLTVVLLALPALTCGFGPAFQELVQRVTALEAESDETGLAIDGLIGDVAALEVESTDTAATIEELTTQVAALEADLASLAGVVEHELGLGPTTTLFDDDFEDGIDSEWVQTVGSTQTIEPTTCTGAHFYPSCGSL